MWKTATMSITATSQIQLRDVFYERVAGRFFHVNFVHLL